MLTSMPTDAPQPPQPTALRGCQFSMWGIFGFTTVVALIISAAISTREIGTGTRGLLCHVAIWSSVLAIAIAGLILIWLVKRLIAGPRGTDDRDST